MPDSRVASHCYGFLSGFRIDHNTQSILTTKNNLFKLIKISWFQSLSTSANGVLFNLLALDSVVVGEMKMCCNIFRFIGY